MKLLFDQNLSLKRASLLADLFPGSSHAFLLNLDTASDAKIWEFAKDADWVIVTRDADFIDMSAAFGFPPYVVQLRLGNCPTTKVHAALRNNADAIFELPQIGVKGVLTLL